MDYAKVLPATGGGVIIAGSLGYWAIALIASGIILLGAVLLRKFFPIGQ